MSKKQMIYDPPSGWKYGFPKAVPEDVVTNEEFKKWLLDSGYPEDMIELGMKYGRSLYKDVEDED